MNFFNWKKVKTESTFMKMAKETLISEISYKDYKKDESATSKQKVIEYLGSIDNLTIEDIPKKYHRGSVRKFFVKTIKVSNLLSFDRLLTKRKHPQ